MPYCPECLTEYREGSVECMDCGVPLGPGRRLPLRRPRRSRISTSCPCGFSEACKPSLRPILPAICSRRRASLLR